MYFGCVVTVLVTASWVGATHCIKFLYVYQNSSQYAPVSPSVISTNDNFFYGDFENDTNELFQPIHIPATVEKMPSVSISSTISGKHFAEPEFNAPFFATWFCTNFVLLFFPIFLVGRLMTNNCNESPGEIFGNIVRGFRDRGFTIGRFFNRCIVFCILWLITTYLYILSLRPLLATDAMSLFATNVASAYLLSWVILHEQFVGVRVSGQDYYGYFAISLRLIVFSLLIEFFPDCCCNFGNFYSLNTCVKCIFECVHCFLGSV